MLDAADNLIDRRNDRESKERDHDANHDDHERLKQCCGVTRCLVDFVFVELGKVALNIQRVGDDTLDVEAQTIKNCAV